MDSNYFDSIKTQPHLRAGFVSLNTIIAKEMPNLANELNEAIQGQKPFTISNSGRIYGYLENLIMQLPDNCIWLGTSKLNLEVWNNDTREEFRSFDNQLKSRTKEQKLIVQRIYLIRNLNRGNDLLQFRQNFEATSYRNDFFDVRALEIGEKDRRDFTVLLKPKNPQKKLRIENGTPFATYIKTDYELLCAIEFNIEFSTLLKEITVHSPKDKIGNRLGFDFDEYWNNRHVISLNDSEFTPAYQKDIQKEFSGFWFGEVHQDEFQNEKNVKFTTETQIRTHQGKIIGTFKVHSKKHKLFLSFDIYEGFWRNGNLTLHYQYAGDVEHYGTVIMRIDESNNVLKGRYVGYGYYSKGIVTGGLMLKRKALPKVFISYSFKDEVFSYKLYLSLYEAGFSVWQARQSMESGDDLKPVIKEAILNCDKIIVILSKTSSKSKWVEIEIDEAKKKEKKKIKGSKPKIIFPISIDDLSESLPRVLRSRHITDFRDWTNEKSYALLIEGFIRLLK